METQTALQIIREACAGISANLATHQQIQGAIRQIELELAKRIETPKEKGEIT